MRLDVALARLRGAAPPVLRTADAVGLLGIEPSHASHVLSRLAESGHLVRLKRGLWAFPDRLHPLAAAAHLAAPFPSYLSLQTALYHHGMISQVPALTYAVSPARTRTYLTPLGAFSIHHVREEFFFGYETVEGPAADARGGPVRMAGPEKALVDFIYLGPARSRLFAALPELELPERFDPRTARKMLARAGSDRRARLLAPRLEQAISSARAGGK
jgi:hypothetical protein